jgi:hypothetical protein
VGAVAVAVANSDGFLLRDPDRRLSRPPGSSKLTVTTVSPHLKNSQIAPTTSEMLSTASKVDCDSPDISVKQARNCEITDIFHRCKIFLRKIENFCQQGQVLT